ncbi:hypothetical protein VCRA2118O236_40260 [Vibrio crassostreae]|nr:hypothetical protein VCRA2118O236_40260 [Vibrio crassostreae]CAK3224854.1 hypothetical protein VCRA2128O309_240010 [Vibrio crassostreae]
MWVLIYGLKYMVKAMINVRLNVIELCLVSVSKDLLPRSKIIVIIKISTNYVIFIRKGVVLGDKWVLEENNYTILFLVYVMPC